MESHCLPLRELPHTGKLFAAFLDDFQKVSAFYFHPPTEAGILAAARQLQFDPGVRRQVVEILREQNSALGAGEATFRNLDRLAAGAAAIVTGQQVALFGGPAYSVYKALTVAAWAARITATGTDAVPIFWLATEDHDLAEINHCFWPSAEGSLRLELEPTPDVLGHRVGEIRLGERIEKNVEAASAGLAGPHHDGISSALRESYRAEETFGSAFGKLMARVARGRGLIFVDPLDARLHRIVASVYRRAIEEADLLTSELFERSRQLEAAGFPPQVKITLEGTLVFASLEGPRLPLRRTSAGFSAGERTYSKEEALACVERTPELFSPSVLLRPAIQDSLLPTIAYFGGPAEIAYMAQVNVVYRRLLGRMPAILPRASFTLIEPNVARLLRKYEMSLSDVVQGRQHVRAKIERESLSGGLAERFEADEKVLREMLDSYRGPLEKLDRTLTGALETSTQKMLYQFSKLRESASRAENSRNGVLDRHERTILDSLYPQRALQERSLSLLPFLASHGPQVLDEIESYVLRPSCQHQVLFV